jgi:chemotaxis protein CheZ
MDDMASALSDPQPRDAALQPLAERLSAIRSRYPDVDLTMIAEVVRAVLDTTTGLDTMTGADTMPHTLTAREASLLTAVEELGRTIAGTKAEIAALRMDEVSANHIPLATDELDAIVAHTAAATDTILECCETLDALGPTLSGEPAATLQDVTTRVYEACSFQDITGQRITKVVAALKAIEAKVADISVTFSRGGGLPFAEPPADATGIEPPAAASGVGKAPGDKTLGEELLNGPQLPAHAMVQSDIDRLLASFD